MTVFDFDICVGDYDSLHNGVLCTRHMIAIVMADTFQEANLTASQIAYGMTGGMVTWTRIRI